MLTTREPPAPKVAAALADWRSQIRGLYLKNRVNKAPTLAHYVWPLPRGGRAPADWQSQIRGPSLVVRGYQLGRR